MNFVNSAEIPIITTDNDIPFEDEKTVTLHFLPYDFGTLDASESRGEYIRDTATVQIIDDDSKNDS